MGEDLGRFTEDFGGITIQKVHSIFQKRVQIHVQDPPPVAGGPHGYIADSGVIQANLAPPIEQKKERISPQDPPPLWAVILSRSRPKMR